MLLPGHVDSPMNYRDNAYDFRQDSSFLYFCGLQQPELALVLDIDAGAATLYGDDIGIDHLVWTGPLPSVAERAGAVGHRARRATRAQLAQALAGARARRPPGALPQALPRRDAPGARAPGWAWPTRSSTPPPAAR